VARNYERASQARGPTAAAARSDREAVQRVLRRALVSMKRLDRESFQIDVPEEKSSRFVELNGIEPWAS
jgi:hypothetical protein